MDKKNVDDYLMQGMYGTQRPKEAERQKFLGTLRERVVIALTIGQVMTDSGIDQLEKAMKAHKDTKLLINGQVARRFLAEEIKVANKYNIPYTIISDEESETTIGAVLTYDYAVNIEDIYISDEEDNKEQEKKEKNTRSPSLYSKIKRWFRSSTK